MALLDLPASYRSRRTSTGYAAYSPYGLIRDDCDCEAEAIFAAQDHADALAQDAADAVAEDDDLPATIELPRAA